MLTINRCCSNRIITRALALDGQAYTAILPPQAEYCIDAENVTELQDLLNSNPGAMIVFNQHPDALERVKQLETSDQQIVIEIRQETRGVLGLQARYINAKSGEVLELIYQ